MQFNIDARYASELIVAVLLWIAAIILYRYTKRRVEELPPEDKHLGRPLFISAVGVFLLGFASLLNYLNADMMPMDPLLTYYQAAIVAPALLTIAALMILGWQRYYPIPIVLMVLNFVVALMFPFMGVTMSPQAFIGPFTLALYILPIGLFAYLAYRTKRTTSLALFLISITFLLFPLTAITTNSAIISVIITARILGPALAIIAFYKADIGFGFEVFGYTFGITILGAFLSYLHASGATGDLEVFYSLAMIGSGAALGAGTGTYTLTRWQKSRNPTTMMMGVYFFTVGVVYGMVAMYNAGFVFGLNWAYALQISSVLVLIVFNLSAFYALEWKRAALLPVIIALPLLILLAFSYPTSILAIPGFQIMLIITEVLQNIIPLGLFLLLWWRMRKADAPGRSRALFLGIGVIFFLIAVSVGVLVTFINSSFLFIAFFAWWMAVTGYADKLLKTTGE